MPQPSARHSRQVNPPKAPPRNAPLNLPTLAIRIRSSDSPKIIGSARTARLACRPATPKNTGMNRPVIRPRSCSSMWRVRIGDCPTRMPATNAPSTVWTPIACVISAITPITIRIVVITGRSLTRLSLAQRISNATARRPIVKLTARNNSVPRMLSPTEARSIVPCPASPRMIASRIQPIVSSIIAEVTISWPIVRRR